MKIEPYLKTLSYIITNDCKQACVYCIQKRGKEYLTQEVVKKSLALFYDRLLPDFHLSFYGGEPLLGFDRIRYIVDSIDKINKDKKVSYSLTTCGEQLTPEMIKFFARYDFALNLSFDGYRAKKDYTYKDNLFRQVQILQQFKNIQVSFNLVSGPDNVNLLTDYIREMVEEGVAQISFSFDIRNVWDPPALTLIDKELENLVEYLFSLWQKTGSYPVSAFKTKKPALLKCSGAQDRLAITPDGKIWGCYLFHDFFRKYPDHPDYGRYSLGDMDSFEPKNTDQYDQLRQYYFAAGDVFCVNCELIGECTICPITAALINQRIGVIPGYLCEIEKIKIKYMRKFSAMLCLT